jgi:hypothetical protein
VGDAARIAGDASLARPFVRIQAFQFL